ncbi:hypothetical protein LTR27_012482 [Elasticomyces elasticus]|nr:hypothetical protein LTR27_012482 [Elasticomyces elasticus]
MSTPAAPHLLGIPRELRNAIYDLTYESATISASHSSVASIDQSAPGTWIPRLDFLRTPALSITLVCKQIHHEYEERAWQDNLPEQCNLIVNLKKSNLFRATADLNLKANAPAFRLVTVKCCRVHISIMHLLGDHKRYAQWFMRAQGASPTELEQLQAEPNTPTKGIRDAINIVLGSLRRMISPAAEVRICMYLNGNPKRSDFPQANIPALPGLRTTARKRLLEALHMPTLKRMCGHWSTAWPFADKLSIECMYASPLHLFWQPLRADGTRQIPGKVLGEGGMPRKSKERVVWHLTPTSDVNNWDGFMPSAYACKDASGRWIPSDAMAELEACME